MNVVIDDAIRRQPELLESVNQANAFLEQLAGASSDKLNVEWSLTPHDTQLIELGLAENADYRAAIRPTFPTRNMYDQVNRELRVSRAWDYLLQARLKQNRERIDDLIRNIDWEAVNGR